MAEGNKSEKATSKKRRDERKKGNVFLSKDAIAVISLVSGFFVLRLLAGGIITQFSTFYALCMNYAKTLPVGQVTSALPDIIYAAILFLAKTAGVLLAVAIIASVAATFFQTKLLVSGQSIKPKFNRISPIEGFKRLFSMRSVVEALKGLLKIIILLYITYQYIKGMIQSFFNYINVDLVAACSDLFQHTFTMVMQIVMAFVVLAGFDFFYQWWDYERKLRMTKQEIKEEYKQVEGDPKIKQKIKEMQRKMSQSRMMQAVPEADVVIRNPEHVAVALRYNPTQDIAPVVLAKGMDELALRIVKVAEDAQVPTVQNIPLARTLYATAEIGQEIPSELYGAVADVLVYLYKIGGEKKR